jgi:type IV pilus biogenesis protein CpaD/CtpE
MQAGLTAQEGAALRAIAADWRAGDSSIVSTGQALVKAGAAANAVQLQALGVQRQQLVTTHINQLQSALGPARFQILDTFVRTTPTTKGGTAAPAPK